MYSSAPYRKLFICEVFNNISQDVIHKSEISKPLMKVRVMGVVVGIKNFSQRTIYAVDDGSAKLDCVLWHNKATMAETIKELRKKVNSDKQELSDAAKEFSHILLNRTDHAESFARENYTHGDSLLCLGVVKAVRGKLLLNIHHHNRVVDVDSETMWILDVLASREKLKPS